MSNELESFIQLHKAKLAQEKSDLQQVYAVYGLIDLPTCEVRMGCLAGRV